MFYFSSRKFIGGKENSMGKKFIDSYGTGNDTFRDAKCNGISKRGERLGLIHAGNNG